MKATLEQPMTMPEVAVMLAKVRQASKPGTEDGTRVHIHYGAFMQPTPEAEVDRQRAAHLGLDRDRYTGRISKVWKAKNGDLIIRLWVELERKHKYRSLNVSKGRMYKFVILGN